MANAENACRIAQERDRFAVPQTDVFCSPCSLAQGGALSASATGRRLGREMGSASPSQKAAAARRNGYKTASKQKSEA